MQSEFGVGRVWSSCQGKDEGRHKACPYGAGCVVGSGWRDWAGTRPAPTVWCGSMGLVGGTGQARGLHLRCGVCGWEWVAGLGQAQGLPLPGAIGGHYGRWRTVSGTEWDGGEGWFWRGALRGRSPCTREGRRPDRQNEAGKRRDQWIVRMVGLAHSESRSACSRDGKDTLGRVERARRHDTIFWDSPSRLMQLTG